MDYRWPQGLSKWEMLSADGSSNIKKDITDKIHVFLHSEFLFHYLLKLVVYSLCQLYID